MTLTNTIESISSVTTGALTFVRAHGVQAAGFFVTALNFGHVIIVVGTRNEDRTLVDIWS